MLQYTILGKSVSEKFFYNEFLDKNLRKAICAKIINISIFNIILQRKWAV